MSETIPDVATDTALRLIAHQQRRRILQCLRENGEAGVSFDDLAAEITGSSTPGNRGPRTELERAKIAAYHNHLPRLDEHAVIEWDQESGVATRGPAFDAVEPVLSILQRHSDDLPTGYLSAEA